MIENLITSIRKILVSLLVSIIWVLFLPTALMLETIALVIWFLVLLAFAVLDNSKKRALDKSWIKKFPVLPKVVKNTITNARMWADSLNTPPNYKANLTLTDGFASIHSLIIFIAALIAGYIIITALNTLNLFKGWGLIITASLFCIWHLVIRLEKANDKKQRSLKDYTFREGK